MQCQSNEQSHDECDQLLVQRNRLQSTLNDASRKIETNRLTLRKPDYNDKDAIYTLANNIAVASMLSRMPYPYKVSDACEFVNKIAHPQNGNCVYVITHTKTGELIGCCGIEQKPEHQKMEIGYWLGEPYWGKGYATEASHALVDMAFEIFSIKEIIAHCRIGNLASRQVLQKSGFQFFGTTMNYCLAQKAQVPAEIYRLERKVWHSLKSWTQAE